MPRCSCLCKDPIFHHHCTASLELRSLQGTREMHDTEKLFGEVSSGVLVLVTPNWKKPGFPVSPPTALLSENTGRLEAQQSWTASRAQTLGYILSPNKAAPKYSGSWKRCKREAGLIWGPVVLKGIEISLITKYSQSFPVPSPVSIHLTKIFGSFWRKSTEGFLNENGTDIALCKFKLKLVLRISPGPEPSPGRTQHTFTHILLLFLSTTCSLTSNQGFIHSPIHQVYTEHQLWIEQWIHPTNLKVNPTEIAFSLRSLYSNYPPHPSPPRIRRKPNMQFWYSVVSVTIQAALGGSLGKLPGKLIVGWISLLLLL